MTMKTVQKKLEAILSHKADTEVRHVRHLAIGKATHQGDVYCVRVADDHQRGKPWGSRQVAVGTNIGSRHVAVGDVEVFAGVEGATDKLQPNFDADLRRACLGPVVVASGPWVLEHPEHAHHAFSEAGTYQVIYQLDRQTMQRVQD